MADKRIGFNPSGDTSLLRAASVVLALLKKLKVRSLSDLSARLDNGQEDLVAAIRDIRLTDEQSQAIGVHWAELLLIRSDPTAALAQCPACGGVFAVSGAPPRSCPLTLGCSGAPAKAKAAVQVKPHTG